MVMDGKLSTNSRTINPKEIEIDIIFFLQILKQNILDKCTFLHFISIIIKKKKFDTFEELPELDIEGSRYLNERKIAKSCETPLYPRAL